MGTVGTGDEARGGALSSPQSRGEVGGGYVKVMTDEQLELLRCQISAYTTICEQLVQMHSSISAQQDHLAGMRLGNIYCDSMMTPGGHKIATRQRWTPTSVQLQILEQIFDQGNGTPGKRQIKEITDKLSQHGLISESNVYNWFQNRRARSKRKQVTGLPNAAESEAEGEIDSLKEKGSKAQSIGPREKAILRGENVNAQSPELNDDVYCLSALPSQGDDIFEIDRGLRYSDGLNHVALFESVSTMDYLIDKMEVSEGFCPYQLGSEYDIAG